MAAAGLALLALAAGAAPSWGQGAGDLLITPQRVIFENRDRATEVVLINQGTAMATYRISFQQLRMTADGALVEIEQPQPDERFADTLLRYAPRQVTLAPREPQIVRLLVRKPAGLADGEYRSHLLFRAVPPETAGTDIEAQDQPGTEIQVRLVPIYGISIPVIVRHGALSADVAITDLALERAGEDRAADAPAAHLAMRFTRTGSRSVYGDVSVRYRPAAGGGPVQVGLMRGIACYTPYDGRALRVPLRLPDGLRLDAGRLDVVYRAVGDDSSGTVLAEGELVLP